MTKICSKCGDPVSIDEFQRVGKNKEYTRSYCKQCQQKTYKKWVGENKEKVASYQFCYIRKYWRENHKRLQPKRKEYYTNCYKERHNLRRKERRQTEPSYRIKNALRARIGKFVTGKTKSAKTMELLGCNIQELRYHLQKQFQPGMTWKNHSIRGWHIDHIKPCTSFDLTDPKQQRRCFHYSNLQPLWWRQNISKGNKT